MAYAYCQHPGCTSALPEPTAANLRPYAPWECFEAQHENELPDRFQESCIADLSDTIEELKARLEAHGIFS